MPSALRETQNIFNLLYTHGRTEEILKAKGIKVISIESIRIKSQQGKFLCCIQTTYRTKQGRCSTFLSCWDYLKCFTLDRKLRSRHYIASQDRRDPTLWHVSCPTEPSKATREIHLYPDSVTCTCEDFHNQQLYFQEHPYLITLLRGKLTLCKHAIAALHTLGIRSYQDYFLQWQQGGQFYKQEKEEKAITGCYGVK